MLFKRKKLNISSFSKKADSCCTREKYALSHVEQNKQIKVIRCAHQNLCHSIVFSIRLIFA